MTLMQQWPEQERPRERLMGHGPDRLTDAELLALLLGTARSGSDGVMEVSRGVLGRVGGLGGLSRCTPAELMGLPGIGRARACTLSAAVELARRLDSRNASLGDPLLTSRDVYRRVKSRLALRTQEVFVALSLDARNRVLSLYTVARGSSVEVQVHPSEVFRPAIREGAAAVIVAHNHPSGDPEPSEQDRGLTRRLKQAAEVLGLALLDHLVVGAGTFVSFADRGWM